MNESNINQFKGMKRRVTQNCFKFKLPDEVHTSLKGEKTLQKIPRLDHNRSVSR